jgi:hypothetical protein
MPAPFFIYWAGATGMVDPFSTARVDDRISMGPTKKDLSKKMEPAPDVKAIIGFSMEQLSFQPDNRPRMFIAAPKPAQISARI